MPITWRARLAGGAPIRPTGTADAVIETALDPDPARRFESADAMRRALEAAVGVLPRAAHPRPRVAGAAALVVTLAGLGAALSMRATPSSSPAPVAAPALVLVTGVREPHGRAALRRCAGIRARTGTGGVAVRQRGVAAARPGHAGADAPSARHPHRSLGGPRGGAARRRRPGTRRRSGLAGGNDLRGRRRDPASCGRHGRRQGVRGGGESDGGIERRRPTGARGSGTAR